MLAEEFIADIVAQFRDKKDDERNRVFYNNVTTFANKCPEIHLKEVYDYIVMSHTYSTPFQIAKLYTYANGKKWIEERKEKGDVSWLTCVKCGTHYSMVGRGCPKCRDKKATVWHDETYPDKYIDVKEDCYYCTIYPNIKKNDKWMTAIGCEQYGKKQDPTCRPCQCKECCRQMMMYKSDSHGTRDKYVDKELAQPWLIEVEPLNETVKHMVADIARKN